MRKIILAVCATLVVIGMADISAVRCEERKTAICTPGMESGFVESVKGRWIDSAHQRKPKDELQQFSVLCDDSRLAPFDRATPGDFVKFRYLDGTVQSVQCSNSAQCSQPITFVRSQVAPSGFFQVLKALLNFQAPPPAEVVSRGATLRDAVLVIKAGQLPLGPAVRFADPDTYIVGLCRLDLSDTTVCAASQFEQSVDIDGPDTKPVPIANLKPGLYQLELRNASKPGDGGSSAWILLCNENDFPLINARYQNDVGTVSRWNDPLSATDFSRLERLYLVAIAKQM